MKRLLFLLLLSVPSFAACTITTFVSGTTISAAPMNANFASLNTCKPQRFTGTILPGNISGSLRGDIYTNTATNQAYLCFAVGPCTAVAPGNWVLLGSGGGGGTGTVTVVGSGSLTSTACVSGGGLTTIQTPTGCVISSTGDITAHSFSSSDTTHSGGSLYNGLTSGSVMLAAADVAGTAIVYVLPSTNGTSGQVLTDNGVVACPTLSAGSPSVCHQLTWATGGGGGSGTVTSVGLTGTANQITVTGSSPITTSGTFALSIPTNPTLPGTTTGTFSGNLTGAVTGNASTATALAANPTDCAANTFANAIAANGNLTCAASLTLTTTGSSGAATFSGGTLNVPQYAGGTGCVPASTAGKILTDNGAGGCTSNTTGTGVVTALASNVSGTGSICLSSGSACSGGGGGSFVLVEQHTASSSASLDFTTCISSTYDTYQIEFVNIFPATTGAIPIVRVSTNGGSSYDAGANYSWTGWRWLASGSGTSGVNSDSAIGLTLAITTTANTSFNGTLKMYNPGSAIFKAFTGQFFGWDTSVGTRLGTTLGAFYEVTTAVNAFQFKFDTGNVASGTVRCYGIAK